MTSKHTHGITVIYPDGKQIEYKCTFCKILNNGNIRVTRQKTTNASDKRIAYICSMFFAGAPTYATLAKLAEYFNYTTDGMQNMLDNSVNRQWLERREHSDKVKHYYFAGYADTAKFDTVYSSLVKHGIE